jgi:CheY-like chemotaxis protein
MDPARILVVEDDEAIRVIVTQILELEGYQVTTAQHGQAALEWLAQGGQPALILTDVLMPVMDGLAFVRALQQQGSTTPVMLMAASPHTSTWATELGVAAWIAKPFALKELLAGVERCLASSAAPESHLLTLASVRNGPPAAEA